ncbi:hypothetical protein [Haloglomus litoreum]|uniref:hypothetical protein n=1 Tax=Haloglomus litoreum TaxID=3034026 RepID=UPI0023E80849|nr:hypothetical protein [Haloglomus sp. DT116]
MSNAPTGLLPVFVFVAAVGLSWPVAIATFVLSLRVRPFGRALRYVAVGVGAIAVAVALGIAGIAGVEVGGLVLLSLAIAAGLFGAVPLVVSRAVLVRSGVGTSRALRLSVAAWPFALLAAFGVFLAPGGVARYNVTFLTGPALYAAVAAIAALVLFGPAVLGLLAARLGIGANGQAGRTAR